MVKSTASGIAYQPWRCFQLTPQNRPESQSNPAGKVDRHLGVFIWHDENLTEWLRVKATVDDSPYADKPLVEEKTRRFPERARQALYCEFVQPCGRPLNSRADRRHD